MPVCAETSLRGMWDTYTSAVSKNWASLVGEKSYVDVGNQISGMARLTRTEEKNLLWNLRSALETWDLRDWRNRESWRILAKIDDVCQILTNTAATGLCFRSGATPPAATGFSTCHFVRKIPDVKQHRCYGTVYGSIRARQEVSTFQIWGNTPINTIKCAG